MGFLSKILPIVALGVGVIFLGNALTRPASASATATALGQTGSALSGTLGSLGGAAQGLGEGVGSGVVGLLKPFWEIKNLIATPIFDSNVAGAANVSSVAQSSGETNRGVSRPSSSTITWSGGTTRSVPTLSAAAKSFYASKGVSVT
jgi:hypothetical protein|tara:strand:+ start:1413 stop:1853 length:441 start_codon:yes stop_codon:yes gene_type:complete